MRLSIVLLSLIAARAAAQVQLPEGFEIVDIAIHDEYKRLGDINNCGVIVFNHVREAEYVGHEVFAYDNGVIRRVSFSNGHDAQLPTINDLGAIAWYEMHSLYDHRIVRWIDGVAEEVGVGAEPDINNLNHMAWEEIYGFDECFETYMKFFDGQTVRVIGTGEYSDQRASLNDHDEIAWTQYRFCRSPWESEIPLWKDGVTRFLTQDQVQPVHASLNNRGQVAWSTRWGTEIWEDGETIQISPLRYRSPTINGLGDVTVRKWEDDEEKWDLWLYQASGEEPTFYRLTDDPDSQGEAPINDWGEVVFTSNTPYGPIRYMRRIRTGDSEFDGDIDHDDLAKLLDCMTGPMWVERTNPGPEDSLCECRFLDINHDGSVDLRDYARFQENFGG